VKRTAWACLAALFAMPLFLLAGTAAAQEECPTFDRSQPNAALCSPACPCDVGEGGCRKNDDCLTGICSPLAGARFALPSDYGVCTTSFCAPVNPQAPDAAACTPQCPCPEGWGDCDSNTDCHSGLFCGDDYGPLAGMPPNYDICVASCPPFDPTLPGGNFCMNAECPCSAGQGDCDADTECTPGNVCRHDVGKWVGLDPTWDICEPPFDPSNPDVQYCLKWGCGEGEGGCRNNGGCKPGLHCEPAIGQTVGLPPHFNVCTSKYALNLTVSYGRGGQGDIDAPGFFANCVGACQLTAAAHTEVKLSADIPTFGRVEWSGCTRISGRDCYVAMNGSKQVSATLKRMFGFERRELEAAP
jgi:hypothetical protein